MYKRSGGEGRGGGQQKTVSNSLVSPLRKKILSGAVSKKKKGNLRIRMPNIWTSVISNRPRQGEKRLPPERIDCWDLQLQVGRVLAYSKLRGKSNRWEKVPSKKNGTGPTDVKKKGVEE